MTPSEIEISNQVEAGWDKAFDTDLRVRSMEFAAKLHDTGSPATDVIKTAQQFYDWMKGTTTDGQGP